MIALLLAASGPQTAVDVERAFATAARHGGQWTAFRGYAAPDATMFVPQPVNAQAWLKDRNDPPRSVEWWPTASFVSCDGLLAVNHGGWRRPDGSVGFFSTVWRRERDGAWRWIVDGGDTLTRPLPRVASPPIKQASCGPVPPRPTENTDVRHAAGGSADRSLTWGWALNATGKTRVFDAYYWDGRRYVEAFEDLIDVQ